LRQLFRFNVPSEVNVAEFLRGFASEYRVEDRGDFFVLRPRSGPEFEFDCAVVPEGLLTNRSGEYFHFLGVFLEALTGHFGKVEVEDA
jgi:hypothetical protein